MNLGRLLRPQSVAVVGASERAGSYGGEVLLNLRRLGYPGAVHAVNPGRASVHGRPCVASLDELDVVPDAVVVAVPAAFAPEVVAQAGALGAGGAVVFAAGFAEGGEPALEHALADAARAHGLPVCGPNGNGVVCLPERVALWGDTVLPHPAGAVSLVSQSGNIAVNALAARRGLRLHTVVSCGNATVLEPADFLWELAGDGGVRSVALYIEDDGDGAAWCGALERCAEAGVGVAVLKAGASPAGAAAAEAHTGAVAGDQRAFRALFDEAGAAWARDPHDLLELAKALAVPGARRRSGGIAVMTCSGGDSSIAADVASDLGLPLPTLAPTTTARLDAVLPPAARATNPLDYTSLLWGDREALRELVLGLAADPAVEGVLVFFDDVFHGLPEAAEDAGGPESWAQVLDAVRRAAAASPVPVGVAATLPELIADGVAAELQDEGMPAVAGLTSGLRVMAALGASAAEPARLAEIGLAARRRPTTGNGGWLAEHEAKAALRAGGVRVPDGHLVSGTAEAAGALAVLGTPLVLKLSAPALRHKSEQGALALGLTTRDQVSAAFGRLRRLRPGGDVLAERTAAPGVELLVAARRDGVVPTLVLALGGVWTEALGDAAVLPLPAGPERVARALRGLRGAGLLTGGRGRPPLDVDAAARLAARVGELLLADDFELIELNPVVVHETGAIAVDALARRLDEPSTPDRGAAALERTA
jgi:acetate---CoA ligase (ADP-forming)